MGNKANKQDTNKAVLTLFPKTNYSKNKEQTHESQQQNLRNKNEGLQIQQQYLAGCSENKRKIYFEENQLTIIKTCREYEVDVYKCIFQTDELYNQGIFDHSWKIYYSGLRHFIPKYYGNSNIDKQTERFQVRLQNLLNIVKDPQFTYEKYAIIWNDQVKSKEFIEARQKQYGWVRNVSYLDLKIGMDCVLKSLDSPEYQEFKDIDLNTTTHLYGFRVTGYCIFQDNSVTDYLCEDFSKTRTYDQVKHIFTQCLTSPSGILVSQKLIKQLIDKIQCLKQFLENQSKAVIKGSSLFFTFARDYFDNFQDYESQLQIVDVHLIDMCHMDIIADEKERDWGFIKGLEETILLLENLQQQSNPNKIKV